VIKNSVLENHSLKALHSGGGWTRTGAKSGQELDCCAAAGRRISETSTFTESCRDIPMKNVRAQLALTPAGVSQYSEGPRAHECFYILC
jgi:hypothetical protein